MDKLRGGGFGYYFFPFSDSVILARTVKVDLEDGPGTPLPRAARPPRPGQRQRRRRRGQRNPRFGYSALRSLIGAKIIMKLGTRENHATPELKWLQLKMLLYFCSILSIWSEENAT